MQTTGILIQLGTSEILEQTIMVYESYEGPDKGNTPPNLKVLVFTGYLDVGWQLKSIDDMRAKVHNDPASDRFHFHFMKVTEFGCTQVGDPVTWVFNKGNWTKHG